MESLYEELNGNYVEVGNVQVSNKRLVLLIAEQDKATASITLCRRFFI